MRKIRIVLLSIGMISFIACSSDDDALKNANCYDCAASITLPLPVEYCDNGDGTIDVTTLGKTETIDLPAASFEEFMTGIKVISSCTKN